MEAVLALQRTTGNRPDGAEGSRRAWPWGRVSEPQPTPGARFRVDGWLAKAEARELPHGAARPTARGAGPAARARSGTAARTMRAAGCG